MPRLSLYKPEKTNDYYFMDKTIGEQFLVGGTSFLVHKYIGTEEIHDDDPAIQNPGALDAATKETIIQDLLFLENRDRKYDQDIYDLRGIYNVADNDFDLSQFGFFLTADVLFINFHLNTMVDIMGRKLMPGDVFELPHLRDDLLLDVDATAINKFYIVQDANRASEGFSQTWYPHIWRVKCSPLIDSQEYKDILGTADDADSLKNMLSRYTKEIEVNDAIVAAAVKENPDNLPDNKHLANAEYPGPWNAEDDWGESIPQVTQFPSSPATGDYVIRTDFSPARMFEYTGNKWQRRYDNDETNRWEKTTFPAYDYTSNLEDPIIGGDTIEGAEGLSQAIKPRDTDPT
tara:strand:- start:197 stop:1234 length:1038 start_codon:yes stop_codon:yes gene_type:complete